MRDKFKSLRLWGLSVTTMSVITTKTPSKYNLITRLELRQKLMLLSMLPPCSPSHHDITSGPNSSWTVYQPPVVSYPHPLSPPTPFHLASDFASYHGPPSTLTFERLSLAGRAGPPPPTGPQLLQQQPQAPHFPVALNYFLPSQSRVPFPTCPTDKYSSFKNLFLKSLAGSFSVTSQNRNNHPYFSCHFSPCLRTLTPCNIIFCACFSSIDNAFHFYIPSLACCLTKAALSINLQMNE